MADHKLLPKHGEHVTIPEVDAKKIVKHIYELQQNASIELAEILATILINDKTQMIMLPCKQCVLDVALQFHDLSELLKEFAGNKHDHGND